MKLSVNIYFVVAIFNFSELTTPLFFTANLQTIRWNLMQVQTNALKTTDESSMLVYNTLREIFDTQLPRIIETNQTWMRKCENFPETSLNDFEARRLSNICDDVRVFFNKIINALIYFLDILQKGILKKSSSELILENWLNRTSSYKMISNLLASENITSENLYYMSNVTEHLVITNRKMHLESFSNYRILRRFFLRFFSDVDNTMNRM
jgi:hypothetical protein